MLKILTFTFNSFGENCSLAWDETGEGVIIDPGFYNDAEAQALFGKIAEKQVRPVMVLLTHGHFDHIFGVKECADKYDIPVYMNQEDNYVLQHNFSQVFGMKEPDASFSTLPLEDGQIIKFGNTEFQVITTPGHTPGGVCFYDKADKVVFTGDTMISDERTHNPFLQPFNEPDQDHLDWDADGIELHGGEA